MAKRTEKVGKKKKKKKKRGDRENKREKNFKVDANVRRLLLQVTLSRCFCFCASTHILQQQKNAYAQSEEADIKRRESDCNVCLQVCWEMGFDRDKEFGYYFTGESPEICGFYR